METYVQGLVIQCCTVGTPGQTPETYYTMIRSQQQLQILLSEQCAALSQAYCMKHQLAGSLIGLQGLGTSFLTRAQLTVVNSKWLNIGSMSHLSNLHYVIDINIAFLTPRQC